MKQKIKDKYPELTKEQAEWIQNKIDLGLLVPANDAYDEMSEEEKLEVDAYSFRSAMLDDLKEMRLNLGLSQEELAKKSGIPRPTISKIENGRRNVTIDTLSALAVAMGKRIELKFV